MDPQKPDNYPGPEPEIAEKQEAVFVAVKTREHIASVTRGHKFLSENRGNLCVKEFDETVRLQKRQ